MLIEVLFVPGCPNHEPVVENLKKVLRFEKMSVLIQEIPVTDQATADRLQFPGSPTVRINGRDIESNTQASYGLACRLYSGGRGVPSVETLRRAVADAKSEGGRTHGHQ